MRGYIHFRFRFMVDFHRNRNDIEKRLCYFNNIWLNYNLGRRLLIWRVSFLILELKFSTHRLASLVISACRIPKCAWHFNFWVFVGRKVLHFWFWSYFEGDVLHQRAIWETGVIYCRAILPKCALIIYFHFRVWPDHGYYLREYVLSPISDQI